MEFLTSILTFIGFFAVTFGLAGNITKWLKASEERKLTAADNHREVTTAIKRIEETLRHLKP